MGVMWTEDQRKVIDLRDRNILVSAAAGSGKTAVLVERIMEIDCDETHPVDVDRLLVVTFTKAAAAELRGKIAAKMAERIAQEPQNRHLQQQVQRLYLAKISTVHSFCADLLREYAYRLDLAPDFRVGDENECRELREMAMTHVLDSAYEKAESDRAFRTVVDTQGFGRDDRLVPPGGARLRRGGQPAAVQLPVLRQRSLVAGTDGGSGRCDPRAGGDAARGRKAA